MRIEPSRIVLYGGRYSVRFGDRLGAGANGEVHATDRSSAVKFFYVGQEEAYHREKRVYIALRDQNLREVSGHRIPLLVRSDDELLAVEMTIVSPPYLLDFASAYRSHEVPDFPPEVWVEDQERMRERFGDLLEEASRIIDEFERLSGFVLLDPHLGNLRFA